ncbi:MAG TPA: DUF6174 domain-containing protein [Actinomycetes bacterium]|nr:DUF6174 domain-containing protein [Actinomycetes bacterium]
MNNALDGRFTVLGVVIAACALTASVLTACGAASPKADEVPSPEASTPAPPEGLDAQAEAAWTRWHEQEMDDYSYRLDVGCFCPAIHNVKVEVQDDHVVTLGGEDYRAAQVIGFADSEPTIEALFAVLGRALSKADDVEVAYDPDTGVPTSISVDWIANAIDDEIGYQISVPEPSSTD